MLSESHERQCAAFAFIVGAQQNEHVFAGDDENQRPKDERQHAEHDLARDNTIWLCSGIQGDPKGIEGARPDVPEHDAHASEGQRPESMGRARPDLSTIGVSAVIVHPCSISPRIDEGAMRKKSTARPLKTIFMESK